MLHRAFLRRFLAVLLTVALLFPQVVIAPLRAEEPTKIDPALQELMERHPGTLLPVIVEMYPPEPIHEAGANAVRAREAVDLLDGLGTEGKAIGGLSLINAAAGLATAEGIQRLEGHPDVAYIHEDSLVQPRRTNKDLTLIPPPGLLAAAYPRAVRADKVWAQGVTGKGVTVAVLDSGIAPHGDLTYPDNRILASVNFVGDPEGLPDKGGHGTHVAGIVAGNGTRSRDKTLTGQQEYYVGIAPEANLVDVRVINQYGRGRVSSVVRGIEWVLAHRDEYNIRVINLSLGAPARQSYRLDPLTSSVEVAWKHGVVVVAAAGNSGPESGTVQTPGIDPYIVTAGAIDDAGTKQTSDDVLGWFSSWGTPHDGRAKPEVVAPGRRIISLRVPGSYLDQMYPDRVVSGITGDDYFRLTGTSMSTPVVSGIVALMLEDRPELTPDQVKSILMATTQPYGDQDGSTDPAADGAGLIDAYAAVNSEVLDGVNDGLRPANSFARALYSILYGQPLSWHDPHYAGIDWEDMTWDDLVWDELAWDNLVWDDLVWDDLVWDDLVWDDLVWDNATWDDLDWEELGWDGVAWEQYALLD